MSFNYFYNFAASQCQYFQGVPLCVHIVSKVVTYEEQGKKNNKMHAYYGAQRYTLEENIT